MRLVCLIFFVFAAVLLPAGSLLEASREAPGHHPPGTWSGKFALVNDSFGLDHYPEWDDGRTSGLEVFLRAPVPLYLELAQSFLTWRGKSRSAEPGSRVDVLHFVIGGLFEGMLLGGRGRLNLGAGGLFFGNFGGVAVQDRWHKVVGQQRPVPPESSYDAATGGFLLSGEASLTNPGRWPLAASAAFAVSSLEFGEMESALWFNMESPYGYTRAGLRYQFSGPGKIPASARRIYSRNGGLWLDFEFGAGGFFVRYSLHPEDLSSQGAVGFSFSNRSAAVPNPMWEGDYRLDYSVTVGANSFLNRVSWSPHSWRIGRSRFGVVLDIHSGWRRSFNPPGRFQTTLAGAEWSMPLGGSFVVEPFGSLSAGYTYEKSYRLRGHFSAIPSEELWRATLRLGAGFRLTPVSLKRGNRILRYSLVIGGLADFSLGDSSEVTGGFHIGLSVGDLWNAGGASPIRGDWRRRAAGSGRDRMNR